MKFDFSHILGRRKLLLSCVLGFFGVVSTPFLFRWGKFSHGNSPNDPRVTSKSGVRAIGVKYLELYPQESAPHVLRTLLPRSEAGIRTHITKDFENGDVVSIGGWILSRTECRVCAIAVLTI